MSEAILNSESLGETLWKLESVRLGGAKAERKSIDEALNWIVKRQKEPGRYGLNFAAPTEGDYTFAILPTGERLSSRAGTAHALGEEAFWALAKWRGAEKHGIREGMIGMLGRAGRSRPSADRGRFCCATCSLAFWRALSASQIAEGTAFIERGLRTLSLCRDEKYGWQGFHFAYAVFTLASLEHPLADIELRYSAGRIERALNRLRETHDPTGLRKLGYIAALSRI